MNIDQAKQELSFHSGRNENIDDPRWERYFLGSLRPYQGMDLIEENFHKVIECLKCLAPLLHDAKSIEKELVCDMSGILCLGKAWAVNKEGMLLSNKLILENEAQKIDKWLDCISYAWAILLDSQDLSVAFEFYNEQCKV